MGSCGPSVGRMRNGGLLLTLSSMPPWHAPLHRFEVTRKHLHAALQDTGLALSARTWRPGMRSISSLVMPSWRNREREQNQRSATLMGVVRHAVNTSAGSSGFCRRYIMQYSAVRLVG